VNLNNLIQKVSSLIGDEMDGDTILLLESHIPDALKTACKLIAANRPVGHDLIMDDFEVTSITSTQATGTALLHPYITLPANLIVKPKFHRVEYVVNVTATGFKENYKMYPVGSKDALEAADSAEEIYYHVEAPRIYFNIPADYTVISGSTAYSVQVRDHAYVSLADYPDELADILIQELIKLIPFEYNKRATQKKK
jgi:hypothetical protein